MKFLFFLLLLWGCSSGRVTNVRKIPLRDFFRNSEMTHLGISPKGRYISYLKPYKNRLNIHIRNLEGFDDEKRITEVSDRDIVHYFWKSPERVVYMRDFGGDENFHFFDVNIKTGETKDLTPHEGVRAILIDSYEYVDDDTILVGLNLRDKKFFDVYRLNIITGEKKLVLKNDNGFTSFLTDHSGKLRGAISTDGVNRSFYFERKGKWKRLITTNFKETFYPIVFDRDERYLYALSNLKRDKTALVLYDPLNNREVKKIFQHNQVDVDDIEYSEKSKKLLAIKYVTWKDQYLFKDSGYEKMYNEIKETFPQEEIKISKSDRDEENYIVIAYSDRNPGTYYVYNKKQKKMTYLGSRAPWLKAEELAPMDPIEYQARDGLMIHGYLTLPIKDNLKNLPLIVIPHGGPWARDVWQYSPTVQFLANRGYAIFQMNFRGSVGYGKKFWMASFKKWGKEMQDDITDGVLWLINKDIADPKRICIYGGSYGGYAVLAGLAFTPNLYACGVDYVGVSNLFTLLKTIPPYWEPYRDMFYEKIGHPEKDYELLKEASPLFHVQDISAPLMVAQGANDPRVKKAESDQIVEALRARGVDVPYILKENEGHGFRNEENRFELYEKMEDFFEKYLEPGKDI
ncbi:MAG: S9 family peptidase [Halobacteriovoraceae bacterium]|nr:S9 family peptidase [Halobacteriovoraceae bacterium]MCB9094057.1 S9 family peptidase [Halobacteriovoraceae bacterium]